MSKKSKKIKGIGKDKTPFLHKQYPDQAINTEAMISGKSREPISQEDAYKYRSQAQHYEHVNKCQAVKIAKMRELLNNAGNAFKCMLNEPNLRLYEGEDG